MFSIIYGFGHRSNPSILASLKILNLETEGLVQRVGVDADERIINGLKTDKLYRLQGHYPRVRPVDKPRITSPGGSSPPNLVFDRRINHGLT